MYMFFSFSMNFDNSEHIYHVYHRMLIKPSAFREYSFRLFVHPFFNVCLFVPYSVTTAKFLVKVSPIVYI